MLVPRKGVLGVAKWCGADARGVTVLGRVDVMGIGAQRGGVNGGLCTLISRYNSFCMPSFRERVLTAVAGIPKGSVMTYAEVAERAGSPRAFRAVGSIMAANYDRSVPLPSCYPFGRADRAYNRGGTEKKKKLLESEGVTVVRRGGGYAVMRI